MEQTVSLCPVAVGLFRSLVELENIYCSIRCLNNPTGYRKLLFALPLLLLKLHNRIIIEKQNTALTMETKQHASRSRAVCVCARRTRTHTSLRP